MLLDVVGRSLPAPKSFDFGLGDWIALGITLVLLAMAFVVPNIVANRASWRKAARTTHTPTNGRIGTPA